jgi:RNA polymerase sigma-70 factor (ECF subfamily)
VLRPPGPPPATPSNADSAQTPDEILTRRAALGDKRAFAAIVARHGPALYRYAYRLLDDPSGIEDILQETFFDAWKGLPRFRGDSSLRTWLFTLTRHRVHARRPRFPASGSRPHLDLDETLDKIPAPHADPAQHNIDASLLLALDAALRLLPARQRSAWILKEIEDLSYAEIATVLAVTPDSVRGLLERSRATLAQTMKEWR